jgi:voltage-gated potassium channel
MEPSRKPLGRSTTQSGPCSQLNTLRSSHLRRTEARISRNMVLDLIIVVVPFFRPLRLLRLFRVGVVFAEVLRRARSILTHNGFHFVVLAAAALVLVSDGLVTIAERNAKGANIHDFGQGLWWPITTVTTVGYGDRYPTTSLGQGVAVFLMLVGIGLIGVLTATIASYFVQERANAHG